MHMPIKNSILSIPMPKLRSMAHVGVLFCILLLAASPVYAQESQNTADAQISQEIFLEILSPFCPGRSLQDCPSSQATDLKNEVRQLLEQGKSKSEIVELLIERYGENILAKPPVSGFGFLAWAVPFVFFVGGLIFVMRLVAQGRKRA